MQIFLKYIKYNEGNNRLCYTMNWNKLIENIFGDSKWDLFITECTNLANAI